MHVAWLASLFLLLFPLSCTRVAPQPSGALPSHATAERAPSATPPPERVHETMPAAPPAEGLAVATFAGGCFWCMEAAFEGIPGVQEVISGYTGGTETHPSYAQVSRHETGHAEAIRVLYDPARVRYEQLLQTFWRNVDPTTIDRSFSDVGRQYRSVIFVHSLSQRAEAERSKRALEASGVFRAPIVTTIEDATMFWVAEREHQDFHRTHPERYGAYREGSGRRSFLQRLWGADATH